MDEIFDRVAAEDFSVSMCVLAKVSADLVLKGSSARA